MCRPLRKGVNRTDAAPLPGYRPAMDTTATELARLVRDRALSAVEIVEAHLRRIEAVNPAINAVVALDADRALAAALEMIHALDTLNEKWTAEGRPTMKVGIGLNFGEAFAGNIGSERRLEFTVIGDTVNTASRLCSAAEGGEILLTEAMRQALREPLAFEPCEPLSVKGKSQLVPVYRVAR